MSGLDHEPAVSTAGDTSDLGFGAIVTRESRQRLLNRDGTFNVRREGLGFFRSLSAYHYLLNITWVRFLWYVTGAYLGVNAVFAVAFVSCGSSALTGFAGEPASLRLQQAFFFSVHTLSTIGYGNISPVNLPANLVVAAESLTGLLGFGLVAGVIFARFARPVARIVFSRNGVMAPYRDITAFMFRVVNQKSNEIVELEAKVMLARRKTGGAVTDREFLPLKLERERVVFFPLAWTIVHPIDKTSPLFGLTAGDLTSVDAEFLIILNGFDETFSQTVHTRSSYKAEEVVWGAKFRSMFNPPREDGALSVDIRKLHDYDRTGL